MIDDEKGTNPGEQQSAAFSPPTHRCCSPMDAPPTFALEKVQQDTRCRKNYTTTSSSRNSGGGGESEVGSSDDRSYPLFAIPEIRGCQDDDEAHRVLLLKVSQLVTRMLDADDDLFQRDEKCDVPSNNDNPEEQGEENLKEKVSGTPGAKSRFAAQLLVDPREFPATQTRACAS